MKNKKKYFFYIFFSLSLFFGLIFGENSSGGARHDFNVLIKYIYNFAENFSSGLEVFLLNPSTKLHSPFFYILISFIFKFIQDLFVVKLIYLLISILLPFLFYKVLKQRFKQDDLYLFLLSLIIFFSPYFRSSAVWLLGDNLCLIFFCCFIFFITKIDLKEKNIKNYYYAIFFLILASYIRYYFAIYYLLIIYLFFKNKIRKFDILKILFFSITLALPAIFYFYYIIINYRFLSTVSNFAGFNYLNVLIQVYLINIFYIIPIVIFKFKAVLSYYIKNKKELLILIFIGLIIFSLNLFKSNNFIFTNSLGGGVIVKFFETFSNSTILLILPFLFSFVITDFFFKNLRSFNYFILLIIVFSLPMNIIYQKYLDPLFFLVFFGLIKSIFLKDLIMKKDIKIYFIYFYFCFFLIFAHVYYLKLN